MTKIDKLYLAILAFMLLFLFVDINAQSLTGSGTEGDPYLIYDIDDLVDMNNYSATSGLHFQQQNDISLADSADWQPIWNGSAMRNFYDGNGYKIKHMNITSWTISSPRKRGLFFEIGQNYTTGYSQPYPTPVSNIVFDSCSIAFTITNYGYEDYIGFLAGDAFTSSLESAYIPITNILVDSTCTIEISGRPYRAVIGGIVGEGNVWRSISRAQIKYTQTTGTSDYCYVAGISGQGDLFFDNVFSGRIEVTSAYDKVRVGGIAGYMQTKMERNSVTGSFFGGLSGTTPTSHTYGGMLGRNFATDYFIESIVAPDTVDISVTNWGYVLNTHESTVSTNYESNFYSTDQAYRTDSYGAMYAGGIDTTGWRKTSSFLKNEDSLTANGFDMTNDWVIIDSINYGFPMPILAANVLLENMSISFKSDDTVTVAAGETITLEWTGTGSYDEAYINDVYVNDSTYNFTFPTDAEAGAYEVEVKAANNPTKTDHLYYYVIPSGETLVYWEGFEKYSYVDNDITATNWKRSQISAVPEVSIIEDGDEVIGMSPTISGNNYLYGTVGSGIATSSVTLYDTVNTLVWDGDTNKTYIVRFDYAHDDLTTGGRIRILDSVDAVATDYQYNYDLLTLTTNTAYTIEDTITVGTVLDSSVFYIFAQDIQADFTFDNIAITQLAANNVEIVEPEEGDYVTPPFTVNWSGLGSYDSVTVNGITVLDTFYTFTEAPTGDLAIGVVMLEDSLENDTVNVVVVQSTDLTLTLGYVQNDSVYYDILANGIDSVNFYIGTDSTGMTYVGQASLGGGIIDDTYGFTKPSGFYGSGTLFYKVAEDKDTSSAIPTPTVTRIGNRGGSQVCWSPLLSDPIEVIGKLDLSCGWNPSFIPSLRTSQLRLRNGYAPDQVISLKECTGSCGLSEATRYAFTTIDTVASDTTDSFYSNVSYYTNTGDGSNRINYKSRRYYIYNEDVYYDDLVNGIDSIQYIDLDEFYNPTYFSASNVEMITPSIALMEYATSLSVPVRFNGTEGLAAAMTDQLLLAEPVFIIHEPSSFQASWYWYANQDLPNSQTLEYDIYEGTGTLVDQRTNFRGIDPKFIREP